MERGGRSEMIVSRYWVAMRIRVGKWKLINLIYTLDFILHFSY
jgi:hypothetical protein